MFQHSSLWCIYCDMSAALRQRSLPASGFEASQSLPDFYQLQALDWGWAPHSMNNSQRRNHHFNTIERLRGDGGGRQWSATPTLSHGFLHSALASPSLLQFFGFPLWYEPCRALLLGPCLSHLLSLVPSHSQHQGLSSHDTPAIMRSRHLFLLLYLTWSCCGKAGASHQSHIEKPW